jgi:hypothetical protein
VNNESSNSQVFCINPIFEGVVDAMGFGIFSWWLLGFIWGDPVFVFWGSILWEG